MGLRHGVSAFAERAIMLNRWIHHYNWHRPHPGIGGLAPISRLTVSRNNPLTLLDRVRHRSSFSNRSPQFVRRYDWQIGRLGGGSVGVRYNEFRSFAGRY